MKRALATFSALALAASTLWAAETTKPADSKPAKEEKKAEKGLSDADKALLDHAKKSSEKLSAGQKSKLMDLLNKGDDKALNDIPGVGPIKANHIKKARPLKSLDDLILVEGIGEKTFDEIITWAAGDMKSGAMKKDEAKPDMKK